MWQIVLNGPGYLDTPYRLKEGMTLLGRAEENHIVLAGEGVSRQHGRLVLFGDTLELHDLGSRNGILVNGRKLEGSTRLREGDLVEVGENRLAILRQDPLQLSIYERKLEDLPTMLRIQEASEVGLGGPGIDPFLLLYRVSERLARSTSLDSFLDDVASLVLDLAGGEAAAVLLPGSDGFLALRALRHQGRWQGGESAPISWTIARRAFRDRTAICTADASTDPRFQQQESVIRFEAGQVICLPILKDKTALGVLYLTRREGSGELEKLVEALTAVAYLAASGLERAVMRERAERETLARKTLERFLAPDVVERVVQESGSLRMEERAASVLFADISGFTPLTERESPDKVVSLLDEFYRKMTETVFSFGGTVDKFIGDEVMAIFGAPYSYGDDAARALRAALAMRGAFEEMRRSHPPLEPCALKIGMHHGKVLAGTVGGVNRLSYTAVGDTVNVASRLVALAVPHQILASRGILDAAGEAGAEAKSLGPRSLKGRTEPVEVFELLGAGE